MSQRDEITITQRDEITRILAVWLSRARSCKMRRKGTKGISPRFVIESTRTSIVLLQTSTVLFHCFLEKEFYLKVERNFSLG